jgi:hypothetical protein
LWQVGLAASLEAVGRRAEAVDVLQRAAQAPLSPEVRAYVRERLGALGGAQPAAPRAPGAEASATAF